MGNFDKINNIIIVKIFKQLSKSTEEHKKALMPTMTITHLLQTFQTSPEC